MNHACQPPPPPPPRYILSLLGRLFFSHNLRRSHVPDSLVDCQIIICKKFFIIFFSHRGYRFNTECLRAELRPCGCATARLYETLSRDFLYPPACPDPATNQKPTVCDVRNEALFMENGSSVVFSSAFIYFVVSLAYFCVSSVLEKTIL